MGLLWRRSAHRGIPLKRDLALYNTLKGCAQRMGQVRVSMVLVYIEFLIDTGLSEELHEAQE